MNQTDFPTFPLFFRWNWPQNELRQQVGGLEISQKCIVTLYSNHGCTHQELCCHTKQTRFAPILFNGKFTLFFAYHISMNEFNYLVHSCQTLKQTEALFSCSKSKILQTSKGGFKSEDNGKSLRLLHKYSKSLSWAENLNKLFTVLGGKFKFAAQDSDLEYLCWRCKAASQRNLPAFIIRKI